MQYKAAGSLSRLAFDQKCVFITKFERAEVGLVVLALEQAGLVTRQEAPALRRHGDRRDLGARSWNTATNLHLDRELALKVIYIYHVITTV